MKIVASFSGGRTSAFMTKYLIERYGHDNLIVVFSNTGLEHEGTLQFVRDCDKYFDFRTIWIEPIVNPKKWKGIEIKYIDFDTAHRGSRLFVALTSKYGSHSVATPHCSREFKQRCVKAFVRTIKLKDYKMAVGIRYDERHRELDEYYPLIYEIKATKPFILNWWSKQSFNLQIEEYQGNCFACVKKSINNIKRDIREQPERVEWIKDIERASKNSLPMFRGKLSISDIVEDMNRPIPLFDSDYETDCICKSS
jgi:hypothetical protein